MSDEETGRPICGGCVGDTYLSHEIKAGAIGTCCFCGEEGPSIDLEERGFAEPEFKRRAYLPLVFDPHADLRPSTLAVDMASLASHDIEAIQIEARRSGVSRRRMDASC